VEGHQTAGAEGCGQPTAIGNHPYSGCKRQLGGNRPANQGGWREIYST